MADQGVALRGRDTTRDRREGVIQALLFLCAALSMGATVGIVAILLGGSVAFFAQVPIVEFVTGLEWTAGFEDPSWGVLPLVSGSLLVAAVAMLVALPLGVFAAVFLSEYASEGVRAVVKPVLELLAGVPTVVYGYFALTAVTPFLRRIFPEMDVFNALSAALVVGIMILPTVASLSEDALRAVPRGLREAGYALGATRMEVVTRVVLPGAASGISAAFILALSRAIGETMAVTIAAGSLPNLTANPLEPVQTMTSFIVQMSLGDVGYGSLEYRSLFAVGLTLFLFTLVMNVVSGRVMDRYRELYR